MQPRNCRFFCNKHVYFLGIHHIFVAKPTIFGWFLQLMMAPGIHHLSSAPDAGHQRWSRPSEHPVTVVVKDEVWAHSNKTEFISWNFQFGASKNKFQLEFSNKKIRTVDSVGLPTKRIARFLIFAWFFQISCWFSDKKLATASDHHQHLSVEVASIASCSTSWKQGPFDQPAWQFGQTYDLLRI